MSDFNGMLTVDSTVYYIEYNIPGTKTWARLTKSEPAFKDAYDEIARLKENLPNLHGMTKHRIREVRVRNIVLWSEEDGDE